MPLQLRIEAIRILHLPLLLRYTTIFAIVFTAVSCTTPSEALRSKALELGYQEAHLTGANYDHIGFKHNSDSNKESLHIYLDGDGTPWLTRHIVADDPTPRNPVMLKLMQLDEQPSLYLGRPCYIRTKHTKACHSAIWTDKRYSQQVVSSMTAALRVYLKGAQHKKLFFFGHSGGGTLAILMAKEFPETVAIVTLAGNLDTGRWTTHHRFDNLSGSLNPAEMPPLPEHIPEFHYIGNNDTNILPDFVTARSHTRKGIHITVLKNFDHSCCWQKIWPDVLQQLDALR